MTDLATIETLPALKVLDRIHIDDAVNLWLAGFASSHTRRAYRGELESFTAFMGARSSALEDFLALPDHQAHTLVDAYRAALQARLAPATINRSMAALNSFVAAMRRHGLTQLRLEAQTVRSRAYRDTRGPGTDGVRKLIAVASRQRSSWRAARDVALVRLVFALGLRRGEVAELDFEHLDVPGATLSIKGKGERERRTLAIPPVALQFLVAWLAERGTAPGALFTSLDRRRLSGAGVHHLIADLGQRAGVTARPHGLRHAAITAVLEATNGDLRKAQAFGRHAKPSTTMLYDDNRTDLGGAAARILDGLVE